MRASTSRLRSMPLTFSEIVFRFIFFCRKMSCGTCNRVSAFDHPYPDLSPSRGKEIGSRNHKICKVSSVHAKRLS